MNKSREITRNFLHRPRSTAGNRIRQWPAPLEAGFPCFCASTVPWSTCRVETQRQGQRVGRHQASLSPQTPKSKRTHPNHCQAEEVTPTAPVSLLAPCILTEQDLTNHHRQLPAPLKWECHQQAEKRQAKWNLGGSSQEKGENLPGFRQPRRTFPGNPQTLGPARIPALLTSRGKVCSTAPGNLQQG